MTTENDGLTGNHGTTGRPLGAAPDSGGGNRRGVIGGTFIVLGLVLFFNQMFEGRGETLLFLVLGAAFITGYAYRRNYGLLIPGCILAGLGLGMLTDRLFWWNFDSHQAVGLGVGFIAVFVVDRVVRGRSHWWPLVPGVVLVLGGVGTGYRAARWFLEKGWPLVFVVIGVLVLVGAVGKRERM